jgi:C4-dicarboxylate transporter DctM subunit
MSFMQKIYESRHLIPVVILIGLVLGGIYSGIATATEAAALGVAGALGLAAWEGSLSWQKFKEGLISACRVYCMIGLILAGRPSSRWPWASSACRAIWPSGLARCTCRRLRC